MSALEPVRQDLKAVTWGLQGSLSEGTVKAELFIGGWSYK